MLFTTPLAFAFDGCRSRWTRCCNDSLSRGVRCGRSRQHVTATACIGRPISRVDGPVKVTGRAKYAAEYAVPNLAYGVVVSGTVARGKITRIDAAEATRLPGVLQVLTHENAPK